MRRRSGGDGQVMIEIESQPPTPSSEHGRRLPALTEASAPPPDPILAFARSLARVIVEEQDAAAAAARDA